MHYRLAIERHRKAHRPCQTGGVIGCAFLHAQVTAMTIIARRKFLGLLLFAYFGEPLRRAKTAIGMPRCDQLMGILLVERLALRLIIWPKGSADYGSLIYIYAEPCKAFEQIFNGSIDGACSVSIFDAQDKRAASVTRIQPAKKGSAEPADMLEARWTGSKAQTRCFAYAACRMLFKTIIGLRHV